MEQAVFTSERKVALCGGLFLRVLKLTKRSHMEYGKGTNKGTLKAVKAQLHSTELHCSTITQTLPYIRTCNVPK